MKRVFSPLLLSILAAALLAACSTVDDAQVTRQGPSVGFVNLNDEQVVPPGHQFQIFASAESGLTALRLRLDEQPEQDLPLQGSTTFALPEGLGDGEHRIVATVTDDRNVTRAATRKFRIDSSLVAPGEPGDVLDPGDGDGGAGGGGGVVTPEAELRVVPMGPKNGSIVGSTTMIEFLVRERETEAELVTVTVDGDLVDAEYVITARDPSGDFANWHYALAWDTTEYPDGASQIEIKVEDATGSVEAAATVPVTILNDDYIAPTFAWTFPARGAEVTGLVDVAFVAEDDSGAAAVTLYVDDVEIARGLTDTFAWDSSVVDDGPHELRAVASDPAGNTVTDTLPIAVANGDVQAPTVAWVAPVAGTSVTGDGVSVTVTVDEALDSIELFANGRSLGTSESALWDSTDDPDGPVTLRAIAVDEAGNRTVSEIVVDSRNDPIVDWLAPIGHEYHAGVLDLAAMVTAGREIVDWRYFVEAEGTGAREFLSSGSGSIERYPWDARTAKPGPYTLSIEVLDDLNVRVSREITIDVGSVVTIQGPEAGTEIGSDELHAITIGLEGTLPEGMDVVALDILINGHVADTIDDAVTSTNGRVYVYEWRTGDALPGHDPFESGDRVITVRARFEDDVTAFSPGLRLVYEATAP